MVKLNPTCPRKTKTAGVRGVSPVDGKVEELVEEKIYGKDEF